MLEQPPPLRQSRNEHEVDRLENKEKQILHLTPERIVVQLDTEDTAAMPIPQLKYVNRPIDDER